MKMKQAKSSLAVVMFFALSVFAQAGNAGPEKKQTRSDSEIRTLLEKQCQDWNNGDLRAFMSAYLNSEKISFSSSGKVLYGYKSLQERYQKKYGNAKESMGSLSFSELEISELGKSKDSALVLGKWHLVRKNGDLDGVFSLVLIKDGENWKIIHDHTSLAEKEAESASEKRQNN